VIAESLGRGTAVIAVAPRLRTPLMAALGTTLGTLLTRRMFAGSVLAGSMLALGTALTGSAFRPRLTMGFARSLARSLGSGRLRFRRCLGARFTMFAGSTRLATRATRLVT
jgi:hypothetical protein